MVVGERYNALPHPQSHPPCAPTATEGFGRGQKRTRSRLHGGRGAMRKVVERGKHSSSRWQLSAGS